MRTIKPEKDFYTLKEITERWTDLFNEQVTVCDVVHWVKMDRIKPAIWVNKWLGILFKYGKHGTLEEDKEAAFENGQPGDSLQLSGIYYVDDVDAHEICNSEEAGHNVGWLESVYIAEFRKPHRLIAVLNQEENPKKTINDFLITQEERDRFEQEHQNSIDSRQQDEVESNQRNDRPFSQNPFEEIQDLEWKRISISFISDEKVRIRARTTDKVFSFEGLGFANQKKTKLSPVKSWIVLREVFAASKTNPGEADCKSVSSEYQKCLPNDIKDIRRRLKKYFGINENPFHPYKGKAAVKQNTWITKFNISDDRHQFQNEDALDSGRTVSFDETNSEHNLMDNESL